VVHLIGLDPEGARGLADYMGEDRNRVLKGGGAVDHVAFNADDLDGMRRRLEGLGIAYRERDVPDMDLHQVFVEDPNGFTIEINFWTS
jgi:catechol 2,3-dioxygenase-like lactoylglutathione lyase family enzyme